MLPRTAAAFAAAALALTGAPASRAQDAEGEARPTAEQMIEVAREAWRPRGLRRRCPQATAGEIVVCAPDPAEFRVSSSTDDAIEAGRPVADGVPRAPDVFGIPAGGITVAKGCFIPPCPPPMPPLIDLSKIPEPLTPEEAALVFRAEDVNPAEASPAAAP